MTHTRVSPNLVLEKSWGDAERLVSTPACEIWWIRVKSGYSCSLHYHSRKTNKFLWLSGLMRIYRDPPQSTIILAGAGDEAVILPGERHAFTAIEDSEALEIYYPYREERLDPDDIVRLGPIDAALAHGVSPEANAP
jgi:mannose-6-phosphate isomerase-like protein (cupin superfamily)